MRPDQAMTLRVVAPLKRAGLWSRTTGIPVLMYHSVSDDPEPGVADYYRLATGPALFRRHMEVIRELGFEVISLARAVEALQQPLPAARRQVVITFDDGFRDFATGAWPVLFEFGFTASVFLPTQYIGDKRDSFVGRECLTWDEVISLQRAGVSFGSHTVSHPKLATLEDASLRHELSDSRRAIEDRLGNPVDTFAHPYAFPQEDPAYVARFRRAARDAGYRISVTTLIGSIRPADDPMMLKRLPVNGADTPEFFAAKLLGAYDWMGVPQWVVKRLKGLKRSTGSREKRVVA